MDDPSSPVIEPLPPLVPDSATSQMLFDVWSGKKLICFSPPMTEVVSPWAVAIVAAHLCIRASFSVNVVGERTWLNDCAEHVATYLCPKPFRSLRSFVSDETHSAQVDLSTGPRSVRYATQAKYDLVIATEFTEPFRLGELLATGRQVLLTDPSPALVEVDLTDRTDLVMPLDVAMAGGVEEP